MEGTKDNIEHNYFVVKPLARLMGDNHLTLPAVDRLIEAVTRFYDIVKMPKNGDFYYQQGWALRRLCTKLKSCIYRDQAPQDDLHKPCLSTISMHHVLGSKAVVAGAVREGVAHAVGG